MMFAPASVRTGSFAREDVFHVEWIDAALQIPAELWKTCFPATLEGAWYYDAAEHGFQGSLSPMRFAYGVIRAGREAVGIVPTFTCEVPVAMGMPPKIARGLRVAQRILPQSARTKTLFVGSPSSICGAVGLRSHVDFADVVDDVARAVELRATATRSQLIAWKGFPAPANTPFERLTRAHGFTAIPDFPESVMDVPSSWEGYMASLNAKRRYALRKKLQAGKQIAPLESSVVQFPDPATLLEIHGLHQQTCARVPDRFMHVAPEFFHRIARTRKAHFVLLRERETARLVAFMLCFILKEQAVNRFTGLDYRTARQWNLHFRLWEEALRFMISAGATKVYSGQTTYRFKKDIGHSIFPMTIYAKHRNPLINSTLLPIMRQTMEQTNWMER